MELLLDQDVYFVTRNHLINSGHDVVLVSQLGLSQASDEEILRTAQQQNRILITRDRDYGNLVFVKAIGAGVIYLRILPASVEAVHRELARILQTYSDKELAGAFVVVESSGIDLENHLLFLRCTASGHCNPMTLARSLFP